MQKLKLSIHLVMKCKTIKIQHGRLDLIFATGTDFLRSSNGHCAKQIVQGMILQSDTFARKYVGTNQKKK